MSLEGIKVVSQKMYPSTLPVIEAMLPMPQVNLPLDLTLKPMQIDFLSITLSIHKWLNRSKTTTKKIEETEQWNSHGSALKLIMTFSHSKLSENNIFHGWDGWPFWDLLFQLFGFLSIDTSSFGNNNVIYWSC